MALIELGSEVQDTVTGLKGIAVSKTTWINGCVRYAVQPKIKKGENTSPDAVYVDQEQLKVLKAKAPKKIKRSGGPTSSNPRRAREDKR